MKRDGLQIAGGVLEIIAGAYWLAVCLGLNKLGAYFGLKLEMVQILAPICFILFGALTCTGRRAKSDLIIYGIINLAFIGIQFYFGTYVGLGIVQMVLLGVAALLYFIAKGVPRVKKNKEDEHK